MPVETRFSEAMPSLDIRRVGNGPKRTTAWLDGIPCIVKGFTDWPKVGEKHLIDEVLYRLVEISDRWVSERKTS